LNPIKGIESNVILKIVDRIEALENPIKGIERHFTHPPPHPPHGVTEPNKGN